MKGIRGAVTVKENKADLILEAVQLLLKKMITKNKINKKELISIIFTATYDLDSEYPAVAARNMGFTDIPLMCYQEMRVNNSLKKCIRVMIYINRNCSHQDISHVYLRKAKQLRPDLN